MRTILATLSVAVLIPVACLSAPSRALAAGALLHKSGPVQVSDDGRLVFVVDRPSSSIACYEPSTGAVSQRHLPGCGPTGLSLDEDSPLLWLACTDDGSLQGIDIGPGMALRVRLPLPGGSAPGFLAVSPDRATLIAALPAKNQLAVLDLPSRTFSAVLDVPRAPLGVAWSEDSATAWVNHARSDGENTRVTEVDLSGPEPFVRASFRLGVQEPQRSSELPEAEGFAEGGAVVFRGHLAQRPSVGGHHELWLPAEHHNVNEDLPSPDSTIQSVVHRLDLDARVIRAEDRRVFTAVDVHDPVAADHALLGPGWNAGVAGPIDIGFSADGSTAYVLHENSGDILVVPAELKPGPPAAGLPGPDSLTEIRVGGLPRGMAISPTRDEAYVYESAVGRLWIVDLVAEERLDEPVGFSFRIADDITLERDGRLMFHGSADPRISRNEKVACASCHVDSDSDGLNWAFQNLPGSSGPRATLTIRGLATSTGPAIFGLGQLHRGGDVVQPGDFIGAYTGSNLGGTGFPAVAPPANGYYGGGGTPIPVPQVVDPAVPSLLDRPREALTAYMNSVPAPQRSPHRKAGGRLSEAAVRGALIFDGDDPALPADAGCSSCHRPDTAFLDRRFHDVGSRRLDEEELLAERSDSLRWRANTPSLVGLFDSAPYDDAGAPGRQRQTMEEVLLHFATRPRPEGSLPHGRLDGLSRHQLADLAEFVLSIDAQTDQDELRGLADRQPPRVVRVAPTSESRVEVWFDEAVEPASAEDPANWRLETSEGLLIPVDAAVLDRVRGDRVSLRVPLPWACGLSEFVVVPGPIRDRAGDAAPDESNRLDVNDPANRKALTLTPSLTVTLGASGAEQLVVPVHDAGLAGPASPQESLTGPRLGPAAGATGGVPGFVRFEWLDAFVAATGVTDPARILSAAITFEPGLGDSGQELLARRVLQPWSDADRGEDGSLSAPTWERHGGGAWNAPGAGALGGTGDGPADYLGDRDRTEAVDASVRVERLGERVRLEGGGLTAAYRLWMGRPELDFGHSLEIDGDAPRELELLPSEEGFGERGPVLEIRYALPPQDSVGPPSELSGSESSHPLRILKEAEGPRLSFERADLAEARYLVYEGSVGDFDSHRLIDERPVSPGSGDESLSHEFGPGDRYLLLGLASGALPGSGCGGPLGPGRRYEPVLAP